MLDRVLPTRKPNRLKFHDYSSIGTYFITLCTKERKQLFWDVCVGATTGRPQIRLSSYGEIVDQAIHTISKHYPMLLVEQYVIMPDHIHLLLHISDGDGRPLVAPTISSVMKQFKGSVSKRCGESIWQKGFYDHVVRGQEDYDEITAYILNNPQKWIKANF